MSRRARRLVASLALPLFSASLALHTALSPSTALAQDKLCSLKGTAQLKRNVELSSASSSGEPIARFTGQPVELELQVPAKTAPRFGLRTLGGFRLDGFIEPHEVPAYAAKNITVVADHVWIGAARRVQLAGVDGTQVSVELLAGSPIDQRVKAKAGCDELSIDFPSVKHQEVPGHARGFLVKKAPLELRGSAGGPVVFTFTSESIKDSLLFWSTERAGGQVRVRLLSDLVIDGWVAATDLSALKEGEMMDALGPGTPQLSKPQLMMQGEPRKVEVSREVVLRSKPEDKGAQIGSIAPGTRVLIIETVLGWSNVVPESLVVMPPEGKGIWAKTAELTGAK